MNNILKSRLTDSQCIYVLAVENELCTDSINISVEELEHLYNEGIINRVYSDEGIRETIGIKYDIKPLDKLYELAEELRELFSFKNTGQPGKRGDLKNVKNKLIRFVSEYSIDEDNYSRIIRATKLYLEKTDMRYLMACDNFIYKRKDGTKDSEASTLGVWMEELEEIGDDNTNTWSTQV